MSQKMELEHVFDHFTKYRVKMLLGDFKAKVERERGCRIGSSIQNSYKWRAVENTVMNPRMVKDANFFFLLGKEPGVGFFRRLCSIWLVS